MSSLLSILVSRGSLALFVGALLPSLVAAQIQITDQRIDTTTGGDYRNGSTTFGGTYGTCFSLIAQASPRTLTPEVEVGENFYSDDPQAYENRCSLDMVTGGGIFPPNAAGCRAENTLIPTREPGLNRAVCITEQGEVTTAPGSFDFRFFRNVGPSGGPIVEDNAYAWSFLEADNDGFNEPFEIIQWVSGAAPTVSAPSQWNACLNTFRAATFDNELFIFDPLSGIVEIQSGGNATVAYYFLTAALACREQNWELYIDEFDGNGEQLVANGRIGDFAFGKYLVFDLENIPDSGAVLRLATFDVPGGATCSVASSPASNSHLSGIFVSGTKACDDPAPAVDLEKFTNGHDGDNADGTPTPTPPTGPFTPDADPVAQVAEGGKVVWTYRVTNTGTEELINLKVTDPASTALGAVIVCPGEVGNNEIPRLGVGESKDCTASLPGGARNLQFGQPDIVEGCGGRPTYENTAEVWGEGADSGTDVMKFDDSHYCNPPPEPGLELEKFTNGHDGDDANGTPTATPPLGPFTPGADPVAEVAVGTPLQWTYRVRNTGAENVINIEVTDPDATAQDAEIVCPSSRTNIIGFLAPGEFEDCTASLPGGAQNLATTGVNTVPGCGDERPTYENTGKVTGTSQTSETPLSDVDDSHYCNPPGPEVDIVKFTNGQDANDPDGADVPRVAPGDPVTWTYEVTNTGRTSVGRGAVKVTDSILDVVPEFDSVLSGNDDNQFDPGEKWLYVTTGTAIDLSNPANPAELELAEGKCTKDGTLPPSTAYTNVGTVTIPGASDEDPSSYCNPLEPAINLEKFTNGHDGDNANGAPTETPPEGPFTVDANPVAEVIAGGDVTWTYRVTNTGTENLVNVTVTDTNAAAEGASIVCPNTGNNTITALATGASVDCTATLPGGARELALDDSDTVPGCGDARPTYMNMGVVVGIGETSDDSVEDVDDSHYCNPREPGIDIEKTTDSPANRNTTDSNFDNEDNANGQGVPVIPAGSPVTWTYRVTNTGNVPYDRDDIQVLDSVDAVNPTFSSEQAGNGDAILDPGEVWLYTATGTALDLPALSTPPGGVEIVNGCSNSVNGPPGGGDTYKNTATVVVNGETDSDDSHYCNPPQRLNLGDFVWEDEDIDGVQDPSEPGIPGATVMLLDTAGNMATDADGNPISPQTTGNNGVYNFTNLNPGDYVVKVTVPAGFVTTIGGDDPDDDDNTDSNCTNNGTNESQTLAVTLSAGAEPTNDGDGANGNLTVDCGFFTPVVVPRVNLGDFVWEDLDNDGVQDPTEPGIPGAIVMLLDTAGNMATDADGNPVTSQTTGNNGAYNFTNLAPGDYVVKVTAPAGFVTTIGGDDPDDDDNNDSNCEDNGTNEAQTPAVTLSAGSEPTGDGDGANGNLTVDCGFVRVPPPDCDIRVEKTCEVVTPPLPISTVSTCKDLKKVTGLTMVWNGADGVNIRTALGETFNGLNNGDVIMFSTAGGDKDFQIFISGAQNGTSEFHTSCSDKEMNGIEDCGKAAGDGKGDDGSLINDWEFGGMTGEKGSFTCPGILPDDPSDFPTESESCTIGAPGILPSCDTLPDKPETLTWRYDGGSEPLGDCAGSTFFTITNDKGKLHKDFECSGTVDINDDVRVTPDKGGSLTVNPGEEFTIGLKESKELILSNSGGTQMLEFHTSCSQPIQAGATAGALTLVALDGQRAPSDEVIYGIRVENPNDQELSVLIFDGQIGIDEMVTIEPNSAFELITDPVVLDLAPNAVFTNTVMATGKTPDGAMCQDEDSVQVRRDPTPPGPIVTTCKDLKPVTGLTMIWDGPDGVNVGTELGEAFSGVNNGDVISFSTAGGDKDFELTLSGALSGFSTFHTSCSDDDMNGIEDCGKPQGDGKKDKGGVNEWIFDGMAGEKGAFSCP